MNKLQALQLLWPLVPGAIFVSLIDWITSLQSGAVTFLAFTVFVYVLFAPLLIELLWPKKRGSE